MCGKNLTWFLKDGEICSREISQEELQAARDAANVKLMICDYSLRTCWRCNPAHAHFLEDLNDGFLFVCAMGCGRWYYQGVDITYIENPYDNKGEPNA